MKKIDVAREQLNTALELFLQDKSPVSVHSLAGNAREVIEKECRKTNIKPFEDEIKENFPELGESIYGVIIHQYRNALKHNNSEDIEVLSKFNDSQNDHMLYIATENYVRLTGKMTVTMQIFQLWYLSVYEYKIKADWKDKNPNFASYFADVLNKSRAVHKDFMMTSLNQYKHDPDLINDPRTELA